MMEEKEHELKPLLFLSPAKPKILRCSTNIREAAAAKPQSQKDSGGTSNPPIIPSSGGSPQYNSGQPIPPTRGLQGNLQSLPISPNKGSNWTLLQSHPRFGPMYRIERSSTENIKEGAWRHLVKKSMEMAPKSEEATTIKEMEERMKETYSGAIKEAVVAAKTAYGEMPLEESEFPWMLIKDGCFFLQLALLILGYHEELNYSPTDLYFGQKNIKEVKKKWIEAMFFPGNQIPLVVLRRLMAQEFFEGIVLADPGRNITTQNLCEKVLRELFILPVLEENGVPVQKTVHQEAVDVLHGLQLLLLGLSVTQNHLSGEYKRDEDFDLEANKDALHDNDDDFDDDEMNFETGDGNAAAPSENSARLMRRLLYSLGLPREIEERKRTFPCATELLRRRIHIQNLDNPGIMERCFKWCGRSSSGIRGIKFQSRYLRAYLYMPPFHICSNTEHILGNLNLYEKERLREQEPEVSSYLRFMSDIVRTKRDAKLLQEKGIIQLADGIEVHSVPRILNRLASEDIGLTRELRRVRHHVSDYSSPWAHYKGLISVVAILTFLQSVFAVLAYFKPPKP